MSKRESSRNLYVPQMLVATTVVVALPLIVAWALRALGLITSPWAAAGIAVGLALLASRAGAAYWRRHSTSELVFGELLIWGWVRRRFTNARLARAVRRFEGLSDDVKSRARRRALERLAATLDASDPYLARHSRRVARYTGAIAKRLGLTRAERDCIRTAALVHDVGKLTLPQELFAKPAALADDEYELVKQHAAAGAELVSDLGDAGLCAIVRHHHERVDGSGYPDGLAGKAIPIGARIIAVADTFDAIISDRPYRRASPHGRALDVLRTEAGAQLDEAAVRAFRHYYSGTRALLGWMAVLAWPQRVLGQVGLGLIPLVLIAGLAGVVS